MENQTFIGTSPASSTRAPAQDTTGPISASGSAPPRLPRPTGRSTRLPAMPAPWRCGPTGALAVVLRKLCEILRYYQRHARPRKPSFRAGDRHAIRRRRESRVLQQAAHRDILAAPTRFSDFLLRMARHPHVEGLAVALTDPRAAAPPARQGIDRIGDSFEIGCESPRFVWRKHRVRAVEIDMHLVIKSKDRPSGDERDARFGRQIVGSPKGVHVQSPFP